jgi:hypothetical protein
MIAEIYKDEGYKLMGAAFDVYDEQGYGLAEEIHQECQPGGLPDISRGLSASDTPGTPSNTHCTPVGCQNSSALLLRSQRRESLAPLRGASSSRRLSGGVASLRSAQPLANLCEPSGFVSSYRILTLNHPYEFHIPEPSLPYRFLHQGAPLISQRFVAR